jgi:CRP-like cAMP-binding protein
MLRSGAMAITDTTLLVLTRAAFDWLLEDCEGSSLVLGLRRTSAQLAIA